jgi:hypothetical protein
MMASKSKECGGRVKGRAAFMRSAQPMATLTCGDAIASHRRADEGALTRRIGLWKIGAIVAAAGSCRMKVQLPSPTWRLLSC